MMAKFWMILLLVGILSFSGWAQTKAECIEEANNALIECVNRIPKKPTAPTPPEVPVAPVNSCGDAPAEPLRENFPDDDAYRTASIAWEKSYKLFQNCTYAYQSRVNTYVMDLQRYPEKVAQYEQAKIQYDNAIARWNATYGSKSADCIRDRDKRIADVCNQLD